MFLVRKVRNLRPVVARCYSDYSDRQNNRQEDHPFWRTVNILKNDFKQVGRYILPRGLGSGKGADDANKDLEAHLEKYRRPEVFPAFCDVLIIGGGGFGSSIAYWLKKEAREGLNVVVVEKDPTVSSEKKMHSLLLIFNSPTIRLQKLILMDNRLVHPVNKQLILLISPTKPLHSVFKSHHSLISRRIAAAIFTS